MSCCHLLYVQAAATVGVSSCGTAVQANSRIPSFSKCLQFLHDKRSSRGQQQHALAVSCLHPLVREGWHCSSTFPCLTEAVGSLVGCCTLTPYKAFKNVARFYRTFQSLIAEACTVAFLDDAFIEESQAQVGDTSFETLIVHWRPLRAAVRQQK